MNIGDIADLFDHVDPNLKNTVYVFVYLFTVRFLIQTLKVIDRFLTTTISGSFVLAAIASV